MADEQNKKKDRLFSDISIIQVTATALAAVTSMLLASYIGIAGSVIGTAVASVVSTVAASAYKKFMRDSAEKIKELPLPNISEGIGKLSGSNTETVEDAENTASKAAPDESVSTAAEATDAASEGKDTANADTGESRGDSTSADSAAVEDTVPTASAESADSALETEHVAAIARQKKLQRGLIVVCVVSALLAVAASGAVVYLLTTGEGLGAKPSVVYMGKQSSSDSQTAHSGKDPVQADNEAIQPEENEATASSDGFASIPRSSGSSSADASSSASSVSSSPSSASSSSSSSVATPEPTSPEANIGSDSPASGNDDSSSGETTDEDSAPLAPIAQRMAIPTDVQQ